MTLKIPISILLCAALSACATPFGDKVAVQNSPVTKAVETTLFTVGASLGVNLNSLFLLAQP